MRKRLTQKEANDRFINCNLILLDTYTKNSINVKTQCYCGTIFYVKPSNIFNGHTTSCGCFHKEVLKKHNQKQHKQKIKRLKSKIKKPRKYLDLTGKTIEKLKVISYDFTKNKQRYWKCLCKCGRYTSVPTAKLSSGHTKSCGCLIKEKNRQRLFKNIIGHKQKSGNLIVIKYIGKNRKASSWLCQCKCGKTTQLVTSLILSETVKTCGNCKLKRNGIFTSFIALDLHKKLIISGHPTKEKFHNFKVNKKNIYIDIAIPKYKIAIEYNGKYFHKDTKSKDLKRIKDLQRLGWKVLVIKSKRQLPKISTINKRIEKLKNGSNYEVITCKDWY